MNVLKQQTQTRRHKPSDLAVLERALSAATEAMFTVALQRRRVQSIEPEDEKFVFRWWADIQFFIVALHRLRRAARLANAVSGRPVKLATALRKFDTTLPGLEAMRNVGEHFDDYAVDHDKRRHKHVTRHQLHSAKWDGTRFEWLDKTLSIDEAYEVANELYSSLRLAVGKKPIHSK